MEVVFRDSTPIQPVSSPLYVLPPMSENLKNKKHLEVPPKNTGQMSIAGVDSV